MKIKVEQTGNPKFPRYILALENGTYFDGSGWTPIQKKALRYAALPVIKEDWKRLQEQMESSLIELVGTVVVRIAGTRELTAKQIEKLSRYLAAASKLTLDYSRRRPTDLEDLVISTQVWWDLKPKK
jgi:hypothetical protein